MSMTISITRAEHGVPAEASCPCGETWTRPADDPHASTLPTWAREHHRSSSSNWRGAIVQAAAAHGWHDLEWTDVVLELERDGTNIRVATHSDGGMGSAWRRLTPASVGEMRTDLLGVLAWIREPRAYQLDMFASQDTPGIGGAPVAAVLERPLEPRAELELHPTQAADLEEVLAILNGPEGSGRTWRVTDPELAAELESREASR